MLEEDMTVDQVDRQASRDQSVRQTPAGYQLQDLVGRGAFGEVWKACQIRTGQVVALKLLRSERRWEVSQLRQELARLRQVSQHPGIVTLLDADLDGTPAFLAMPYLSGGSLQSCTGVEPNQAREWMESVALALAFSHSQGVFHCDLKPANILLDDQGGPQIVDFGQSMNRGESGTSWGTLGYMPPEQALGQGQAQAGWDLYALGATFYVLLSGEYPRCPRQHLQDLTQSGSTVEHRLDQYVALLQSNPLVLLRHFSPDLDEDLEAIILRCLSLDPKKRTVTAQQVVEDLRRSRQGLPVWANQPWRRSYLTRRWLSRHWRTALPTTILLGLVCLAGLWGLTQPYPDPDPQQRPRALPARPKPPPSSGPNAADAYAEAARTGPAGHRIEGKPDLDGDGRPENYWGIDTAPFLWAAALAPGPNIRFEHPEFLKVLDECQPVFQLFCKAAHTPRFEDSSGSGFSLLKTLYAALALGESRRRLGAGHPDQGWDLGWAVLVYGSRYLNSHPPARRYLWLTPWVTYPLDLLENYPLARVSRANLDFSLKQCLQLETEWMTPESLLLEQRDQLIQPLRSGVAWQILGRNSTLQDFTLYQEGVADQLEKLYASQLYLLQMRDFALMENQRQLWSRWDPGCNPDVLTKMVNFLHPIKVTAANLLRTQTEVELVTERYDFKLCLLPDYGVDFLRSLLQSRLRMVSLEVRLANELCRRDHHHGANDWSDLVPAYLPNVPQDPVDPTRGLEMYRGLVTGASLDHFLYPDLTSWRVRRAVLLKCRS